MNSPNTNNASLNFQNKNANIMSNNVNSTNEQENIRMEVNTNNNSTHLYNWLCNEC